MLLICIKKKAYFLFNYMEQKNSDKKNKENKEIDFPFFDRPYEEVENGYIDDRGFYTTPDGSFWDEDHTYFNHLGFDCHGGSYDKFGVYHPGIGYDEKTGFYKDEVLDISAGKIGENETIELAISKLKQQEEDDEKIIKKYEIPEEESEDSDFEDKSDITFDEEDIKDAYESVLERQIDLAEILNPEVYTGVRERDFHLYVYKPKKQPEYVHIEANEKPICTCKIHNKKLSFIGDNCIHVLFVLDDILHLNIEKENLIYSEKELKKAFELAEKNNKNITRETYGISKRSNFDFPNPKIYMYEYDEKNDNEYNRNEWRIKERLYSRGIVADEFIYPGIDYALIEKTYDKYFFSQKEAHPTPKAYEEPHFIGRQMDLNNLFKNEY